MFKGIFSKEMYIFLLVFSAMFKYSSTSCDYKETYLSTNVLFVFHCTNSSLEEIFTTNAEEPDYIFTSYYVTESSLISLTPDARSWPNLKRLTLENTNISKIVPGFFNGFTELTLLSIPHNNMTVLNDGVFSSLTNLQHLNLSYNSIYNIESLAFVGLSELTIIDLHNNKIKSLPSKLFFGLSQLIYVDLSFNFLASLGKLSLGNNSLSKYTSGEIKLNISNNIITNIENFEMYKAIDINLSFNNIKTLNAVGDIIICNISYNGITFLGKHFIPNSVSILDLSFNSLCNIASNAFDKGTNLTHLYLDNNNLKELSIGTFENQQVLEYLDLSNNKIMYFELGLFNNLKSLKYLNISCNEGLLDFHALFPLNQLETLDFEKNQQENFDKFFLEAHGGLRQIRMGYNTGSCGDLAKIIHLMETRNITVLKGNNVNSTHIHGIECKSKSQFISKNDGNDNVSDNQSLDRFDNTGTNNVHVNDNYLINLNLFFNNVILFLIFGSIVALIWYLKKRTNVWSNRQIQLL